MNSRFSAEFSMESATGEAHEYTWELRIIAGYDFFKRFWFKKSWDFLQMKCKKQRYMTFRENFALKSHVFFYKWRADSMRCMTFLNGLLWKSHRFFYGWRVDMAKNMTFHVCFALKSHFNHFFFFKSGFNFYSSTNQNFIE